MSKPSSSLISSVWDMGGEVGNDVRAVNLRSIDITIAIGNPGTASDRCSCRPLTRACAGANHGSSARAPAE